jgi:hypothetical protein
MLSMLVDWIQSLHYTALDFTWDSGRQIKRYGKSTSWRAAVIVLGIVTLGNASDVCSRYLPRRISTFAKLYRARRKT